MNKRANSALIHQS